MSVGESFTIFRTFMKRYRTLTLLISLLIIIIIAPLLEENSTGSIILVGIFSLILLLGVYAISYNLRLIAVSLFMMIPTYIVVWTETFYSTTPLIIARYVLSAITIFFILLIMLWKILSVSKVTAYEIYGALSVYILVALGYCQIYILSYHLNPGSISIQFGKFSFSTMFYFSFVSLSTTGFGDIVSVEPLTRSVTILELITGVFFVAILIARLIGGLNVTKTDDQSHH
jgi:voltage-gated potassium channel